MKKKILLAILISVVLLLFYLIIGKPIIPKLNDLEGKQNSNTVSVNQIEKWLQITVTPEFDYRYDLMKEGVIQHVDRDYTYDYIPAELMGGILFQGIHRPPQNTSVEIQLRKAAIIYFFFHDTVDGGYSEIFSNMKNWEKCEDYPQYDIHNGDHGLKMKMYKLDARKGLYSIPPTTKDKACFNIVFKFKND